MRPNTAFTLMSAANAGDAYETFMGRWSRRLAEAFVGWLGPEPGLRWLDVGCGTGALTDTIRRLAEPAAVVACDPAEPLLRHARERISGPGISFVAADAADPPVLPGGFDRVVSGLVLNFLGDPVRALRAMAKRARSGGTVAAYVWDYAGGMEFLRSFWDEAVALSPSARELDEGRRFPLCAPEALAAAFRDAGLGEVTVKPIEIPTRFESFEDYWRPFLGGTGPAPTHVVGLGPEERAALRERLQRRLAKTPDAPIELVARAWAIRGRVT